MPEEDLIQEQQAEKRSHRRLLWSFVWMALAILVGAPLLWSWSVTRKWERLKAEYAAAGETLDEGRLVKKHVPDEENVFASIESMMRESPGERERAEFLGYLTSNLGFQLENAALVSRSSFDGAYQQMIFHEEPLNLPPAATLTPETMLQWIDEGSPWLLELGQRLSLPRASHPSGLSARDLTNIVVARGAISVLANDRRVLGESLRMSIRHTEATGSNDAFGYFGSHKWLDVLWLAMSANMLDEAQSRALLIDLERLRPLDYCINRTLSEATWNFNRTEKVTKKTASSQPLLCIVTKRLASELMEEHLITLRMLQTTRLAGLVERTELYRKPLDLRLVHSVVRDTLIRWHFDADDHFSVLRNVVVFQTKIDLAKIALALELYRFRHGHYPESAAALVPEFLQSVPIDLIDGKPVRYRRDGSRYRIWSIGRNRMDDGGKFFLVTRNSSGWTHSIHDGDWVWFYPKAAE